MANRFDDKVEYTIRYKKVYSFLQCPGMPKPSTGARLGQMGLSPELLEKFNDFREAYLGAPEIRLISEALEMFIEHTLKNNADILRRFETAQRKRNG